MTVKIRINERYYYCVEQIERIRLKTIEFIKECRQQKVLPALEEDQNVIGNEQLKLFLGQWQSMERSYDEHFRGANDIEYAITFESNGIGHVIPANCKFINTDIQNIKEFEQTNGYDLIVMDPPWWNKYVRRSKKCNNQNG